MKPILAAALINVLVTSASFAGPRVAVHCVQELPDDRVATFNAYDFTFKNGSNLVAFDGAHPDLPEFDKGFIMQNTDKYRPIKVDYSERMAAISFMDKEQRRPMLMVRGPEGALLGRVVQVFFTSKQAERISNDKREGSVIIMLQEVQYPREGDDTFAKIEFKNCTYQGAVIADWSKMWSQDVD